MTTSNDLLFVAGDTGPKIRFSLKDCSGGLIDTGVSGVQFHLKSYCGACANQGHEDMTPVAGSDGLWDYCLEPGDVSGVGTYYGDVRITFDDGKQETGFQPVRISVRKDNRC